MVPNPIEMDEIWGYHDFLGWHPYRIFLPMEEFVIQSSLLVENNFTILVFQ